MGSTLVPLVTAHFLRAGVVAPDLRGDVTVCRKRTTSNHTQPPRHPADWAVKPLRGGLLGETEGGGARAPCRATGGRRAAVWILGIPGPQRQDVCTGYAASDTDGGAGGGGS